MKQSINLAAAALVGLAALGCQENPGVTDTVEPSASSQMLDDNEDATTGALIQIGVVGGIRAQQQAVHNFIETLDPPLSPEEIEAHVRASMEAIEDND